MTKRGKVVDQFTVNIKTRPDAAAPKGRIEKVTYQLHDTGAVYVGIYRTCPAYEWAEYKRIKFEHSRELDGIETDADGRII